jgi:hypothetical protein
MRVFRLLTHFSTSDVKKDSNTRLVSRTNIDEEKATGLEERFESPAAVMELGPHHIRTRDFNEAEKKHSLTKKDQLFDAV